jgi:hypothetical protein
MNGKVLGTSSPSDWKEVFLFGVLLGAIGLVHGYFQRPGHPWGDDFAQYLMHARNLAEGRPYAATGYIYNPHYPQIGPPAYPPGTPVLLAPVWRLWGLNWTALKIVMIICLLIGLAGTAWYFRPWMPLPVRALLVALLGLNHFFLDQTNAIGSDLPFLMWLYLALVFLEQAEGAAHRPPRFDRNRPDATGEDAGPKMESANAAKIQTVQGPAVSCSGVAGEQSGAEIPAGKQSADWDQKGSLRGEPAGRRLARVDIEKCSYQRLLLWYLATAAAAWAAFATRTVGLVLWAAVLLAEWLRHRRLRTATCWATMLFLLLAGSTTLLVPGISGYWDQVSPDPTVWAAHTVHYARQLAAFWRNPLSKPLAGVIAGVVSLLALIGYWGQCRRSVSVREIFPLLYGTAVVLWPSYQGFRMLDPLVPLWLFYAWLGLEELGHRWGGIRLGRRLPLPGAIGAGLAGAILLCYGSSLASRPTGPLPEGIGRPTSQELFHAVPQHTQPEDVLIFIKPRALALLTDRRCAAYHPVQTDEELWAYLRQIQARFLVVVRRPEAMQGAEKPEIIQWLADFVARYSHRLQLVWTNEDFALYRISQ